MAHNNGIPERIVHKLETNWQPRRNKPCKRSQRNNTTRNGLPLHITVPQYIRSPIYSNTLTWR
jgi:hypothetical protein